MEIRLLMFNCVLMHGYLSTRHIFSPFLSKIRTTETHSNVLLGEKKLYSLLHLHLGSHPHRGPQFEFDSIHASFGCFHCYFL